jgi:RimJ/RimL family protein N-acetyltransferase
MTDLLSELELLELLGLAAPAPEAPHRTLRESPPFLDAVQSYEVLRRLEPLVRLHPHLDRDVARISTSEDLYALYVGLADAAAVSETEHPTAKPYLTARALIPPDFPWIYKVVLEDELSWQWHYNTGVVPPYEVFVKTFLGRALFYNTIIRAEESEPLGVASMYEASLRHRTAHLALALTSEYQSGPGMVEAIWLSISYGFAHWDLRKIYYHVPEDKYNAIASGSEKYFSVEGRLQRHYFLNGQRSDLVILAFYRDLWGKVVEPCLNQAQTEAAGTVSP